jgi:methionyl-tRNA formyltransferase
MHPWPGAWTNIKIFKDSEPKYLRLKILKAHFADEKLKLDYVQLEGKKPISWEEFTRGYPDFSFKT